VTQALEKCKSFMLFIKVYIRLFFGKNFIRTILVFLKNTSVLNI